MVDEAVCLFFPCDLQDGSIPNYLESTEFTLEEQKLKDIFLDLRT